MRSSIKLPTILIALMTCIIAIQEAHASKIGNALGGAFFGGAFGSLIGGATSGPHGAAQGAAAGMATGALIGAISADDDDYYYESHNIRAENKALRHENRELRHELVDAHETLDSLKHNYHQKMSDMADQIDALEDHVAFLSKENKRLKTALAEEQKKTILQTCSAQKQRQEQSNPGQQNGKNAATKE